jgi:uncharacterized coiled-coil DUF342 family protein
MTDIEMQETLARIKRAQAETDKYVDEGRKLRAEADKLSEEAHKLRAEAWKFFDEGHKLGAEGRKFERERTTLTMTGGAAILGAGAVIGGLLLRLLTGH